MVGVGTEFLIIPLLRGFGWFDEGMQRSLEARGWPTLTRPESMVMIYVVEGMVRPTDIARSLGLTRQAVHHTLGQICKKGLLELQPDPDDGRSSIIVLTEQGAAMRHDAQQTVLRIMGELKRRIGAKKTAQLIDALNQDWGPVVAFGEGFKPLF